MDTRCRCRRRAHPGGAGVQGWRIFVFNQKNPDARNFKGVSYYPYDPAFRVTASFRPDPEIAAARLPHFARHRQAILSMPAMPALC